MKMRSILLSVLAIAVLASCAKDNGLLENPDVNAPEAMVTLRLKGNGGTRVVGLPTDLETKNKKVSNLTVFFFNGDDLVNKVYLADSELTDNKVKGVKTKASAKTVVVIANIGSDQTTTGIFAGVTNKTSLVAATGSLTDKTSLTQSDQNVYMSGEGTISYADGGKIGSAAVALNFVSARIDLKVIDFSGAIAKGSVYDTHFKVSDIYLMRVQSATHFLPAGSGDAVKYIEKGSRVFWGGSAWESTTTAEPSDYVVNAEYKVATIPTTLTSNKMEDLGHWYVFDNNEVDDPTVLVVKVDWFKDGVSPAVPLFFNVTFNGTDQVQIRSGHTYTVSLKLNGNLKPEGDGGTGGGGEEDPDTPTVDAAVDITVTAAEWTPKIIDKEWN